MKKKTLSLILAFCMIFAIFQGIPLRASATDWSGYTAISSQSDLAKIAYNLSGKYYLSQSIIISGSWTGIGSSAAPFTGIFDGNGKTITFSGVKVTGTSSYTGGLFNYVSGAYSGSTSHAGSWTAGVVKNVTVAGAEVTSNYQYTCTVIGFVYNAYVGNVKVKDSKVSAKDNFAGGVIGGSDGADLIEKCYNGTYIGGGTNNGSVVTCDGGHSCSGGVVGMAFGESYVKECYNYGSVYGTACDGGIVGHLEGNATVRNCINYGKLYNNWRAGGIVGAACLNEMSEERETNKYETIENCANFGTTVGRTGQTPVISNPCGICAYGDKFYIDDEGKPHGNVCISNCYTVSQSGIYLTDGKNFIALYSMASQAMTAAFMKAAATTDKSGNPISATTAPDDIQSLVDELNRDVMNSGINGTISSNMTSDQTDAGTNEWFFWTIDTNTSSPSYGYPVFTNSFLPNSRGGASFTATVDVSGGEGSFDPGDILTLRQNGEVKYTLTETETPGVYACPDVSSGLYNLYTEDPDTHVATDTGIIVSDGSEVSLTYYTVTLTAGSGVSSVSLNGSEVTSETEYTFVENTPVSIDATLSDGYVWVAWANTAGGMKYSGAQSISNLELTSNLNLTAKACTPTFTATVNIDGGTEDDLTLRQDGVTKYTLIKSETMPGVYTHDDVTAGYYQLYAGSTDTGLVITDGTPASLAYCTVTLTAGTGVSAVKINGSAVASGTSYTYVEGSYLSFDAALSDGYRWTNWTDTSDGTQYSATRAIGAAALTASLDLTANARLPIFTATVNVLGPDGTAADASDTLTLRQGGATEYTLSAAGTTGVYTCENVAEDTYQLYAGDVSTGLTVSGSSAVTLNYYTVMLNAGTGIEAVKLNGSEVTSGEAVTFVRNTPVAIDAVVAGGYLFTNWTNTSGGTQYSAVKGIGATNLTGSLDLTANAYLPPSYTVTLNTNGGAVNSGDVTSYAAGIGATLPADVTKADADFAGWYANRDFAGSPVTAIGLAAVGNKTYYARWAYPVGGSISGEGDYTVLDVVLRCNGTSNDIEADSFTDDGYSFQSVPAGNYNLIFTLSITPDEGGDPTVVTNTSYLTVGGATTNNFIIPSGYWSSRVVTVGGDTPNLEADGLDAVAQAIGGGGTDTVLVELTVEKNDESDNAEDVEARIVNDGKTVGLILDLTLTQTVTPSEGTPTQSTITELTSIDGAPELLNVVIHLPEALQGKENYVVYRYHGGAVDALTGAPNGSGEYIEVNGSRTEITLHICKFSTYAIGYADTSTVTFDAGAGESPVSSISVTYGSTYGTLPVPNRNGYTFLGWYTENGTLVTEDSIVETNTDVTLHARWRADEEDDTYYVITASAGVGGSISPSGTGVGGGSVSVMAGSSQTFTITPKTGYAVSDVLVDGKSVGAVTSYTFRSVFAAHTIKAEFEAVSSSGLPYYVKNGGDVFLGFAAGEDGGMKYIAPDGVTVLFRDNPKNFADIGGHWAKPYIDFVTEREIFVGTGGSFFSPDTGMTRGMFAAVIGRLYERSYGEIESVTSGEFTDVDYASWYGKYVNWASQNGVITGIGGGLYEPGREITRQEMAAILYRFAEFLGVGPEGAWAVQLTYPDSAEIPDWAAEGAMYCQFTGIITGRDGGTFAPAGTAARAEVAVILERFIENTLK